MQLKVSQSEFNLFKQIGLFIILAAVMTLSAIYAEELFKVVMMGFGGWHVGTSLGDWSRKRWPR